MNCFLYLGFIKVFKIIVSRFL